MAKRYNPTNPTEKAALDEIEGRVREHTLSPIAAELRRRNQIREAQDAARNERLRRARELAEDSSDGDVA